MRPKEVELKLFLFEPISRKEFSTKATSKTSAGPFSFTNAQSFLINDIYFDTKNLSLHSRNSYLRLREKNDERQVTLRVFKTTTGGNMVLSEFTHPLNHTGVKMAIDRLMDEKVIERAELSRVDYENILESAGLVKVLGVRNERVEKEIHFNGKWAGRIKYDYFSYEALPERMFAEIELDYYEEENKTSFETLYFRLKESLGIPFEKSQTSKYRRGIENKLFSGVNLR